MRLTCNKSELSESVQTAMRVVNTNATLESLRGVLIIVQNGNTYIKATNLEVGVDIPLASIDNEDGSVLVNPKILIDAIKYSDSKKVTLKSDNNKNILNIELETGETKLKTLNSTEFPNIVKQKSGDKIKIKISSIVNGVKSVIYAVSHSVIKPELSSVYIWQDGQQLTFVATDSFRLAEKKINQNITTDDLSILIPQKNIQDLISILEQLDQNELIDVYIDKDQFSIYIEETYITLRTIDGAFPDYKKIIPSEPTTEITVLKQDLSQIIKKAGVFSDKFNKIVIKVDSGNDKIIINTEDGDFGETKDMLSGKVEGVDVSISVNHKYILDCLQSIYSDSLVLSFFGQGKPMIIRGVGDKSFTYLVMPMNN